MSEDLKMCSWLSLKKEQRAAAIRQHNDLPLDQADELGI